MHASEAGPACVWCTPLARAGSANNASPRTAAYAIRRNMRSRHAAYRIISLPCFIAIYEKIASRQPGRTGRVQAEDTRAARLAHPVACGDSDLSNRRLLMKAKTAEDHSVMSRDSGRGCLLRALCMTSSASATTNDKDQTARDVVRETAALQVTSGHKGSPCHADQHATGHACMGGVCDSRL
jgi:hypothetical protein